MGTATRTLEPNIFEACLQQPPDQRETFLVRACRNQPELRERIARLLEAHDRLEQSGGLDSLGHPKRIGPYEITGILGQGGMGVVYEALQTEPVRRHVAVKVIRRGMDTQAVVARFEAERQALAVMDHVSIARVYDAGATEDGRPWFAMELVRGEPITTYCDSRNLSLRERLHLFVHLCYAIQHAHQKGHVHRDLKPSNVLVVEQGRYAQPKIIDFGIVKAIDSPACASDTAAWPADAGTADLTRMGQAMGTPAYMSPEQASMGGTDVDTRSDIFSLGILFYELICGVLPVDHTSDGLPDYVDKLRRMELSPARPSRRFLSLPRSRQAEIAVQRSTTPARMARELKRDLDWIAIQATRPQREERYGNACQFAFEIESSLRDETVMAHPPSLFYPVGKFMRRNRTFVAAGVVGTMAIMAGGGGLTMGLVRATRAEESARRDAATAERVTGLLQSIFTAADPAQHSGRQITASEMLETGTERVRRELAPEPAVQSRMLATLSSVHASMGQYDRARLLAEQAIRTEESRKSPDPASLVSALVEYGAASARMGRIEDARRAYERALSLCAKRHGEESSQTADVRNRLDGLRCRTAGASEADRENGKASKALKRHMAVQRLKASWQTGAAGGI